MAREESREYTSTGNTPYYEPLLNNKNSFKGWKRNEEELESARYVSKETAGQIIKKYGLEKKAIKHIFNKNNNIDYKGIGGILFYLRKKSKKIAGSKIKRIKPGFHDQEIMEAHKKLNIDNLVSQWIKEDRD
tara:strand:+ start:2752 stop:3147 length:396 start_codon:yes stop_codon:yes gene_type:complete